MALRVPIGIEDFRTLREGLAQLADGGYEAELRAAGAEPIHAFAVAFDGKDVRVRAPA